MTVTRRGFLGGLGAVTASVAAGGIVERGRIAHAVERLGNPVPEPKTSVPATPADTESGSFLSKARLGHTVRWQLAYPPGLSAQARRNLPVAIALHGRGDSAGSVFGSHAWGFFLAAAVAGGVPPFAVAAATGSDHGYWHRRANGEDSGAMILDEFVPMLASRGLRTDRIGLAGWSMGGYGAILLAERLGPSRCAVLAVDSPALWTSAGATAPGAFDNAADYRRNDVFADRAKLDGIPMRVAIGTSDPFYAATRSFIRGLRTAPATDFSPGGHDTAFWRHSAPGQIAFLGRHLAT